MGATCSYQCTFHPCTLCIPCYMRWRMMCKGCCRKQWDGEGNAHTGNDNILKYCNTAIPGHVLIGINRSHKKWKIPESRRLSYIIMLLGLHKYAYGWQREREKICIWDQLVPCWEQLFNINYNTNITLYISQVIMKTAYSFEGFVLRQIQIYEIGLIKDFL